MLRNAGSTVHQQERHLAFFHEVVLGVCDYTQDTSVADWIASHLVSQNIWGAAAVWSADAHGKTQLLAMAARHGYKTRFKAILRKFRRQPLAANSKANIHTTSGQASWLSVGFGFGKTRIGAVLCMASTNEPIHPAAIVDVETAAGALAVRLDLNHAFLRLHRGLKDQESAQKLQRALFEISELSSTAKNLRDLLKKVHHILGSLMYAENFYVALFDAGRDIVSFAYFADVVDKNLPLPEDELPLADISHTATAWVIRHGKPLHGTAKQIDKLLGKPLVGGRSHYWMGVPLLDDASAVLGVLTIQTYDENFTYSARDLEVLTFVARHVATSLQRRRSHENLERAVAERTQDLARANQDLRQEVTERVRSERLQSALFRITELTNATSGLDDFFAAVHSILGELIYARNCYIALQSDDGKVIEFAYFVDQFDKAPKPRRARKGLTEYVLRHGKPTLSNPEYAKKLIDEGEYEPTSDNFAHSWLGVPLQCSNRIVGVLAVQSYDSEHFYTPQDQELLTFVSHHISTALERKQTADALKGAYAEMEKKVIDRTQELDVANERLRHENLHDALTTLPNRRLFMERLERARIHDAEHGPYHFAVLFMDLDRFKVVNDSLGHLVGDQLLVQVGQRISKCLRGQDTIARFGGDEFAILIEDMTTPSVAVNTAERIIQRFAQAFEIGQHEVFTSASIGIAQSDRHYLDSDAIIRDADAAMYHAKAQGRRGFAVFDESFHHQAVSTLTLENDLRRALDSDEIQPYFQPIYHLRGGRISGFEALARWHHPEKGLIQPDSFIPIAEEMGLISELDWRIFTRVCQTLAQWRESCPDVEGISVSVNMCSDHFRHPEFPEQVMALLQRNGLEPWNITLEITETVLLGNLHTVQEVFKAFRKSGIRLSLDDFGTGYSSLSYLHRFPVDLLKIERSFVNNMESNRDSFAIIQTVCTLAGSLGLAVVAEGIENKTQYEQLSNLGCEYGQGYYMSKPVPHDLAFDLLQTRLAHSA